MKISFIGFGSLAKAIARGLMAKGSYDLSAASPSLTEGRNKDNIKTYFDNKKAIIGADLIILAVKPMQMAKVLQEIAPALKQDVCLITVAAGLTLSWYEAYCPKEMAIIRTMPNIAAKTGLAATPMIANAYTKPKQQQAAEAVFSSIGLISWLEKEAQMDSFTALSGSGPAYVFLFMEAMVDAAIRLGLDKQKAELFTLQTFKGALSLVELSDMSLNELRTSITSPNGTTAAALRLLDPQLPELVFEAMRAAKLRSEQIATA